MNRGKLQKLHHYPFLKITITLNLVLYFDECCNQKQILRSNHRNCFHNIVKKDLRNE